MKTDPRIDVLMLPLFDGVTQIKWRDGNKPVAKGHNGFISNGASGNASHANGNETG